MCTDGSSLNNESESEVGKTKMSSKNVFYHIVLYIICIFFDKLILDRKIVILKLKAYSYLDIYIINDEMRFILPFLLKIILQFGFPAHNI